MAQAIIEDVRVGLAADYKKVRAFTEKLCEPLATEDYVIQSMPDCSPTKWHLAHTSWFFERFILKNYLADYESLHPQYDFLFNSYYNTLGERHCRPKRGLISRPTVAETYQYRAYVNRCLLDFLATAGDEQIREIEPLLIIGLHHEQQHQELMVTDIKHVFSENPLRPAYLPRTSNAITHAPAQTWVDFAEGLYCVGFTGEGFSYDNEGPRHQVFLQPFQLASRLVTAGEYQVFMDDGGYERPQFWLSQGWNTVQSEGWQAPMYWERSSGGWRQMTLAGMRDVEVNEPVCHVSYFEAEAYAAWAGARLPTESEWEVAAMGQPISGNFVDNGSFHPIAACPPPCPSDIPPPFAQMYGDVWEWTQSPYTPYPGYHPPPGALGEYNGKFMCNQYVLRGGSCATSQSHIRPTYRNFFPPDARWQFSGIRLAQDLR